MTPERLAEKLDKLLQEKKPGLSAPERQKVIDAIVPMVNTPRNVEAFLGALGIELREELING